MIAFGDQTFSLLNGEAKERGISVQELLRAVIIPDWFKTQGDVATRNPRSDWKTKIGDPRESLLSNRLRS